MTTTVQTILCIPLGYFFGIINPAYLLGKLSGKDIRKVGSGNAGASNVVITMGKLKGAIVAIFDIFKAFLACSLSKIFFASATLAFSVTATSVILGHIFPFYIKFKGGKGLACLGGTILAYDWRVFLIMLACAFVIAIVFKYICFVPVIASIVFSSFYGVMEHNLFGAIILAIAAIIIFYKHIPNFKRINKGAEVRFSFLWNKKKEEDRLRNNGVIDNR